MAAEELAVGLAARKLLLLCDVYCYTIEFMWSPRCGVLGATPCVCALVRVMCVCVCVTSPRVEGYSLLLGLTARMSIVAQPLESRF